METLEERLKVLENKVRVLTEQCVYDAGEIRRNRAIIKGIQNYLMTWFLDVGKGKRMGELRDKQAKFAVMAAHLILWAKNQGYDVTLGDAYRDERCGYGHKRSLHRKRLAIDLNLFKDGKFIRTTEGHKPLGVFWESIGGTWGGRFGDGNHYSMEHRGMR